MPRGPRARRRGSGEELEWLQGVVKLVDKEKGYGFIKPQDAYEDVVRDVWVPEKMINGFSEGELVFFQSRMTAKGPQAVAIELVAIEAVAMQDDADALALQGHDPDEPAEGEWDDLPVQHEGTIVKIDEARGFGFIHCDELNKEIGKDIYVRGEDLNGHDLNDRVRFEVTYNSRGQLQAGNLEGAWEAAAGSRDGAADAEANFTFRGTIRAKTKGNAFIHCPEATTFYGQDVFVHHSKVGSFDVGDPVNFTVRVNHKRQPQAHSLTSVLPPELTMSGGHGADLAEPGSSSPKGCTHQGTIKSVDPDKGLGLIECEQLHAMYGCDTFVDKKQLAGFQPGDSVRFSIRVVRANSRDQPQAVDLIKVWPAVEAHEAAALAEMGAPGRSGGAMASPGGSRRYEGVVKKLDTDKGFGFVFCQDIHERRGVDVYIDKKDMAGLSLNDRVCFGLKTNARGKLQAVSLAVSVDQAGDAAGVEATEEPACSGTIKSFDEAHGYGFISSAEVQAKHNRDVFLHHAQIKNFKVGDHVLFYVRINAKGSPQAYDLREAPRTVAWLSAEKEEPAVVPDRSVEEEEHAGVIKSFNAGKGYGFIDCRALFDRYGRDVFIHQSQFEGRKVGDRVTFKVQVVKGQPQARDVALGLAAAGPSASSSSARGAGAAEPAAVPVAERGQEAQVLNRRLLRACASAMVESLESMQDLLAAGADPNAPDEATGQLPLQVSALNLNVRHAERKCRLLVERGADVQVKCSETHTVLQWARERINRRFAAYLEALRTGDAADHLASELLNENPPEEF